MDSTRQPQVALKQKRNEVRNLSEIVPSDDLSLGKRNQGGLIGEIAKMMEQGSKD